ncbi:MAG TPA: carbohydrate ABC transporter permease [Actinomycetota bacterium]|jgi:multiple sugar transport system permease protein
MRTIEAPERVESTRARPPIRSARRYRARRIAYKVAMYAILIGLCSFIMMPVFWALTAALKPDLEPVFTPTPEWFPTKFFEWDNFRRVLVDTLPFLRYAINTMIIVIGNIIGVLISCSLVGFAFARLRFRGSKVLFYILIVTMLIPWQALMVPQFLFFVKVFHWYGSYLPLIVPSFTGVGFFIFLIRQYMRTIPRDLDDAARVDGLNTWQIFWRIILPLSTPVLTVCAVFTFLGSWNNLLGPLIYLDDDSKFTVAIGLANLVTRADTPWNLTMAANLITVLPTVIVYFFVQKKLIGGIASVGLKG